VKLSKYLDDTSNLLHDANFQFTSKPLLINWINEARLIAARRTGCIQRLIQGQSAFGASAQPGQLLPGGAQPGALPGSAPNAQQFATTNTFQAMTNVERYPFQGFGNSYLKAQHAGCGTIIDVSQCAVSWGTSPRPALQWKPWEDLQALARAYANLIQSYPVWWSVLNDGENGEVWMYPAPPQPLEMEWLVYATPAPLYTDDDYDALGDSFADSVKFLAASLVRMTQRNWAEAQILENQFAERLGISRVAVDYGKVPNYYWTA
jgi:hypothetical protein